MLRMIYEYFEAEILKIKNRFEAGLKNVYSYEKAKRVKEVFEVTASSNKSN